MIKLFFFFQLLTGKIEPAGDVDGRPVYNVPSAGIELAYKGELLEWIETGTFEFNEFLTDNTESK